jgi:transposase, IS5 family
MGKHRKKLSPKPPYISPSQLSIEGFETPFEQHLLADNRWVVFSKLIPWDELCNEYLKHVGVSGMGPKPINPRIVIGALIIKHKEDLDDREVIAQISENVYMQYFLGYSSFNPEPPFDASLFVEIRNRLSLESLNAMNERIIAIRTHMESLPSEATSSVTLPETEPPIISETCAETGSPPVFENGVIHTEPEVNENPEDTDPLATPANPSSKNNAHPPEDNIPNIPSKNKGKVIFDATCCPQDIAYPTDLNLLSDARKKSEQLIDTLYNPELHAVKPRTYRKVARKEYLKTAMKKNKSKKELRRAVKKQLA